MAVSPRVDKPTLLGPLTIRDKTYLPWESLPLAVQMLGRNAVTRRVNLKQFPAPAQLGGRDSEAFWDASEIDDWIIASMTAKDK